MTGNQIILKAMVDSHNFQLAVKVLHAPGVAWMDRLDTFADWADMNGWLLHPQAGKEIILTRKDDRRKRPMFVSVKPGWGIGYISFYAIHSPAFSIELVEAGEYELAGDSKTPTLWRAKESSSLWA